MTDYATRMRAAIDQHTGDGPYVPRIAATEIVAKLRKNDPELLAGWLDEQAEHFVWQAINDRDRSRRSRAVHTGRSSVFREAATAAETGNVAPLRAFLDAPYTVADGSRRRLGELRREDLLFVAGEYTRTAHENGMKAAFHNALAKKVGDGTVAEHFTEPQLAAMWDSIAA